jgi:hypothetical protein
MIMPVVMTKAMPTVIVPALLRVRVIRRFR